MEETTREIIAEFLRVKPDAVNADTVIDRSALKSSIHVHRMFGALANAGIIVQDYHTIKTVGELVMRIEGNFSGSIIQSEVEIKHTEQDKKIQAGGVGIDIEEITNIPDANDYREDQFFQQNFSELEISYCIMQPDSKAAFAGLFAAKEAIVKAKSEFKNLPFSKIAIEHTLDGKPVFAGFDISISHTREYVVAVAVSLNNSRLNSNENELALQEKMAFCFKEISTIKRKAGFYAVIVWGILLACLAGIIYNYFI